MNPFKLYTFKEDIDHEIGFTIIQPQGYYKSIDHMQRVGNLISNSKIVLKKVPRQTAQIVKPPQGGKASLKFVIFRCA